MPNKNTQSKPTDAEQESPSGLDETTCSVSLNHEQISFLRESLEKRRDKAANEPRHPIDKMWGAYLDGVIEDAEELLRIIQPCAAVVIFSPNVEVARAEGEKRS